MNILLVGYGKMGRLIEELAPAHGCEIASCIDVGTGDWTVPADVAVDFSTADALRANFARYVERGLPAVIGTTGWSAHEADLRAQVERAGLGVVASANFSIGVNLFQLIVAEAARLLQAREEYGAWIHEAHHAAKRDAPSGTALLLRDTMVGASYGRPIDVSSTRAGTVPGIHTIGFDGPSDTIELTHTARDRRGFAAGALLAARWIQGRRGWYTMADVLRGS
ncbi:MAG: 4-hydroxy-tetrahydrodipicolinate reductase [Acidobacteria bacterium]|nr:4-hydroxy-tetrahydrodipicolinate reductase [Acidobacteriota bacterium]